MLTVRTDLAMESHRLWRESTKKTTDLAGVRAEDSVEGGFPLHRVEILDREGEEALGKPRGTYVTVDITDYPKRGQASAAAAVAALLTPLLPAVGPVLVAGLGSAAVTADALGHETVTNLLVTRHLGKILPDLRPVAALAAGVVGATGIEAAEWIQGVAEHIRPAAVIVVDALAARDPQRLCTTVQLADTGLIPGSGVGNHRMALNRQTLGFPVVSVGVPTVVDGATLARDLLERGGEAHPEVIPGGDLFLTPTGIDRQIRQLGRILGLGISMALQPDLAAEDVISLLE